MNRHDVVIVGAGILGLAHALAAAKRGMRVAVVERSTRPEGASARNFGMVWPVGLPAGPMLARGLRSRQIWDEVAQRAGLWHAPVGSLHLAYHEDERQVLREFAASASERGYQARLIDPAEAMGRSRHVVGAGLLGALWSETEMNVDPREALAKVPDWLARTYGVEFNFETVAVGVEPGRLVASDGRAWPARRIVICSGPDTRTLFPGVLKDLALCKLQMMRSGPQGSGFALGPMLAAGLTLRHYRSFAHCPTVRDLAARIAREMPEIERCGIHVLVSQASGGELVFGDSHQYGADATFADAASIERLIMTYLATFFTGAATEIAERWHGVYAKRTDGGMDLIAEPVPGVHIVNGVGGMGMTMSFGLAEEVVAAFAG